MSVLSIDQLNKDLASFCDDLNKTEVCNLWYIIYRRLINFHLRRSTTTTGVCTGTCVSSNKIVPNRSSICAIL